MDVWGTRQKWSIRFSTYRSTRLYKIRPLFSTYKMESEFLGKSPKNPDILRHSRLFWCRERDLNPHGFPHTPLKRVGL